MLTLGEATLRFGGGFSKLVPVKLHRFGPKHSWPGRRVSNWTERLQIWSSTPGRWSEPAQTWSKPPAHRSSRRQAFGAIQPTFGPRLKQERAGWERFRHLSGCEIATQYSRTHARTHIQTPEAGTFLDGPCWEVRRRQRRAASALPGTLHSRRRGARERRSSGLSRAVARAPTPLNGSAGIGRDGKRDGDVCPTRDTEAEGAL